MDDEIVIQLEKLTKRYPGATVDALHEVSLTVKKGQVFGFLGPNGAGKSTTIRTLLNFIQPTSGSASIMGRDIVKDSVAVKHLVGYLAGDVALYGKMTGEQFLEYMAELHPLEHRAYMKKMIKDFEVQMHKPLQALSRGNRQKFGVIQALMHEPDALILDEPTTGLDPLMQEVFFDHVDQAKKRGAGIFLSSHNLGEVQRICDRIGFINEGKLVREKSLAELSQNAAHTFDITFADKAPLDELRQVKHARVTRGHIPNIASIAIPAGSLPQLFSILSKQQIQHFSQREVNLGEEFMEYYREANHG